MCSQIQVIVSVFANVPLKTALQTDYVVSAILLSLLFQTDRLAITTRQNMLRK